MWGCVSVYLCVHRQTSPISSQQLIVCTSKNMHGILRENSLYCCGCCSRQRMCPEGRRKAHIKICRLMIEITEE